MFNNFSALAAWCLDGGTLSAQQALAILVCGDDELMDLVAAASLLRRRHFGNAVKVNYLVNLKSGKCPEDCSYCSQRLGSQARILDYSWLDTDEAVRQARAGIRAGASRVCLAASGRGPSNRDVGRVTRVAGRLKQQHPQVEVCACLGILSPGQAAALRAGGVDAYNHNINTSQSRYAAICSTHDYRDRVRTIRQAANAGLSPCSGLIAGMGESDEELVEAVFALRMLGSDSIPVNFLMPFDGTPLEGTWQLTPARCLRILAMVRFACPGTELRMAGGREMHLRSLQPFALHVANSLFLGDYLTSEGQEAHQDLQIIRDAGFRVLSPGQDSRAASQDAGSVQATAIRRRGAGTLIPPNA
jgi:biotin synthase